MPINLAVAQEFSSADQKKNQGIANSGESGE